MIEPAYFSIDGAPGRYFQCPNGLGTLSEKACGDSYKLSWQPDSIACGRRFNCRHCIIGKLHSGEQVGKESRFFGKLFCCRCERSANRLIHGSVCVSCYNREREVKIGKNARGTTPVALKMLFSESLIFATGGKVILKRFDEVASVKEAVLTYARQHDEKLRVGWCYSGDIVRRVD